MTKGYYCQMKIIVPALSLLILLVSCDAKIDSMQEPHWQEVNSPFNSSLRGIAAIDSSTCWASGSNGKVILTTNGGKTWFDRSIPRLDTLQFRDIHAFDKDNVIIISAGLPAVIAQTSNAGRDWIISYFSKQKGLFFDALDFWDEKRGIAFSDAPDSLLYIMTTEDGGEHWKVLADSLSPPVFSHQGGFAASGTCLITYGNGKAIIGLGGPEATILQSNDFGNTWRKSKSPLDAGEASKGNFSFSEFQNQLFVVGGDYLGDSLSTNSIAKSIDDGNSWQLTQDTAVAGKYRSSIVQIDENRLIATSRTGSSYSLDAGLTWTSFKGAYFSLSKGKDGFIWGSGAKGKVARLIWE